MSKRSINLLEMTARRQGKWGNLIADGPLEVAEAIGGDGAELGGAYQARRAGDA